MDNQRIEQRIIDLELRYMRTEKMFHDLSDVLVAHQKTIDRLAAELASLRARVPEESDEAVPNERPPHY